MSTYIPVFNVTNMLRYIYQKSALQYWQYLDPEHDRDGWKVVGKQQENCTVYPQFSFECATT